jgi:hypothetical protein
MTSTVPGTATLHVTTGPDRGKVFRLETELVHVGRGPENQIDLTDAAVAEHQASIVRRNGRYAIFTPLENVVLVDGSPIPADHWIWLPETARIRLSDRTLLQFGMNGGAETATPSSAAAASDEAAQTPTATPRPGRLEGRPVPPAPAPEKRQPRPAAKPPKAGRKVARFITDQAGDHLVTLGEDGQLPELSLAEGTERKASEPQRRQGNPAVIYVAVAVSLLLSMAMLFIDAGPGGSTADERAAARRIIARDFFGDENGPVEPYQVSLREAHRAHARRDRVAERRAYHRVLESLNSEDVRSSFGGLTGSRRDDERLRELIGILLND